MNSNKTVQTEVALQKIRPVSNLGPHMKVAQIRIEKVRFHVISAVHTVMQKKNRTESNMNKTINNSGFYQSCFVNQFANRTLEHFVS